MFTREKRQQICVACPDFSIVNIPDFTVFDPKIDLPSKPEFYRNDV
ncbi:MAG: hypothetical protein OEO19_17005 [Gammaproteobacteria bacterium]|nr:hypothetical protein [Gammaproteobacteria bacterium]MDH3449998.1 hypothetical protein [Gammaproteobacteria bacterium]